MAIKSFFNMTDPRDTTRKVIAENLLKNRKRNRDKLRSQEEKKSSNELVSSTDEPPAKKQKKNPAKTLIPFTNEEEKALIQLVNVQKVYSLVLDAWGLHSTFSEGDQFFYSYPIVFKRPDKKACREDKNGNLLSAVYGFPNPETVFVCLKKIWSEFHSDSEDIANWSLWINNIFYYGISKSKKLTLPTYLSNLARSRTHGGTELPKSIVPTKLMKVSKPEKSTWEYMNIIFKNANYTEKTVDNDFIDNLNKEAKDLIESGVVTEETMAKARDKTKYFEKDLDTNSSTTSESEED